MSAALPSWNRTPRSAKKLRSELEEAEAKHLEDESDQDRRPGQGNIRAHQASSRLHRRKSEAALSGPLRGGKTRMPVNETNLPVGVVWPLPLHLGEWRPKTGGECGRKTGGEMRTQKMMTIADSVSENKKRSQCPGSQTCVDGDCG